MGVLHQLRILLWKNFTLKKRSPMVMMFEVFIPLVLFLIVLLIRKKQPAHPNPASLYTAQPLPSAGVIAIMQQFCDGGTEDSHGFKNFHNNVVYEFLENFNKIAKHSNFFDPGFTPDQMEKIPSIYKSIIEDPAALHHQFKQAQDFQVQSLFKNKKHVHDVFVQNLSMPVDETDAILNARVNVKELYRVLFGSSLDASASHTMRVRRSIADKLKEILNLGTKQLSHKVLHRLHLPGTTDQVDEHLHNLDMSSDDLYSGLVYRVISGGVHNINDTKLVKTLQGLLGLDNSTDVEPHGVALLLERIMFSPTSLHTMGCDREELLKILIPREQNETESLIKSQSYVCNMSQDHLLLLSNTLMEYTDADQIVRLLELGSMNLTNSREKVRLFAENLHKFSRFEKNLLELSNFAKRLPQDACEDVAVDNSTFSNGTASGRIKGENKVNKYAGLLKIWIAMQSTICGRSDVLTKEQMDTYSKDMNLDKLGLTKKQQSDIGILVHVLYSNPKVLYAPNGTDADKVIHKANQTFALMDLLSTYATKWLNVSTEMRNYLEMNSTAHNLEEIKEMQSEMRRLPGFDRLSDNMGIKQFAYNVSISDPEYFLQQLDIVDNAACSWLSLIKGISLNVFRGFKTEEEVVHYFLKKAYHDNVTVLASVIFDMDKDGSLPPHITYKIRQNASFTQSTRRVRPKYWYPGPKGWGYNYYQFGFIWIQDIMERALIDTYVGRDVVEPGGYVQQFPYPCFTFDDFLFMIEHVMPLCLTISWVYSVAMLVQNIVYEKEQRLKEVMKMMGLANSVHWVAWFITSFLQMSITMGILTIILRYGRVLTYSNVWLVFTTLEIFAVATIMFCFLVSVLYSKAKVAAACAGIVYFLTYVPYMYIAIREEAAGDHITAWAKSIACLFSTTAFGLGAKYFAFYEIEGVGVQWENIHISPVEDDQFNLLSVNLMMLLDTFIYGLLVWYIENVHPGSYGLPKPWYFPFTKSYWCGHTKTESEQCSWRWCWYKRGGLSVTEDDQACAMEQIGQGDRHHFEADPAHLTQGVCIDNLVKIYKNGKLAVNKLSLNFYEGQITSLLGHNGAGKTTIMSILTGMFPPTSGYATIYGNDIRSDMSMIRQSLGMCPQHNVLFDKLTVEEHLWFYAKLKGMSSQDINKEMESMIQDVGLPKKRKNKVDCLSGGMKRKLSVAIAFVAGSRTVILDEPTAGIDPYARRAIWDLLIKYKKDRTIILSTHHMDEADILGDRIAIISNGQLRCSGSSLFLKSTFGEGYHLALVKKPKQEEDLHSGDTLSQDDVLSSTATNVAHPSRQSNKPPFATRCVARNVTAFISKYVSTAYIKLETSQELHYILPFEEAKKGSFEKLFKALDQKLCELELSSYGVVDTSLEEVFLKVADKSQGVASPKLNDVSDVKAADEQKESTKSVDVSSALVHLENQPADNQSILRLLHENDVEMGTASTPRGGHRRTNSDIGAISYRQNQTERFVRGHRRTQSNISQTSVRSQASMCSDQSLLGLGRYARLINEEETASSIKDEDIHSMSEGAGSYVVTGGLHKLQQFIGVITKRYLYIRRNWKALFSQILLPALFVCIAMTVALSAPQEEDLPPIVLSPAQYFNVTQPMGNFIPYSDQKQYTYNRKWTKDAMPKDLIATLRLPSGVAATCVLRSPFNSSFDAAILRQVNFTHQSYDLLSKYFFPSCESVFVRGLRLKNFVPPPPASSANTREFVNMSRVIVTDSPNGPRYYPSCICNNDKSGYVCLPDVQGEPPSTKIVTSDIILDITGQKESDYFLYTTDKYRLHRYGALSFGNMRDYVPEDFGQHAPTLFRKLAVRDVAKVWYNHKGFHAMPLYVNTLNNAILRANIPKGKGNPAAYGITAINHPMNNTNNHLNMEYILQGSDVLIAIFIIVAMSFVPASFVLFLVYERAIKAKHLQFVSGIHPIIYWLANYMWDMCNYLIPGACCILILQIFDIPAYVSSTNFPAVISLFVLYGWSITPMMYPASFWFDEPSTAYICLIVINLFIGITCLITSFLLELFKDNQDLGKALMTLKSVFLIFPNYCLGRGLMDIAFNEYENQFFFKTGQYSKMKSPLQWDLMVRNLVAMASMGLIFFLITILCEYRFFIKSRYIQSSSMASVSDEDEDVANERKRVLRGRGRRDALRLENLTKIYSTRKLGRHLAVDRLCLGVPQGECFGLLGVNGAGKTSTFKMLTGDIPPTGGNAYLNGDSIIKDMLKVQQNIGYCPQFDALYDELTAREHLMLYARLRGIPPLEQRKVVDWALNKLGLAQYADKLSNTYSGGNKRKLSTAIALLGNPPVIFLDEPTTGMDPYSRRFLWDLILSLVRGGRSVVLTSHSMEECEALCTRLAIMVNGHFKCIGSIQHLKNKFGDGYTVTIRMKGPDYEREVLAVSRFFTRHFPSAVLKEQHYNILQYELQSQDLSLAYLFSKMEEAQIDLPVEDYSISQNTLDNVFINFVKQQTEIVQESAVTVSPSPNISCGSHTASSNSSQAAERTPILMEDQLNASDEDLAVSFEQTGSRLSLLNMEMSNI